MCDLFADQVNAVVNMKISKVCVLLFPSCCHSVATWDMASTVQTDGGTEDGTEDASEDHTQEAVFPFWTRNDRVAPHPTNQVPKEKTKCCLEMRDDLGYGGSLYDEFGLTHSYRCGCETEGRKKCDPCKTSIKTTSRMAKNNPRATPLYRAALQVAERAPHTLMMAMMEELITKMEVPTDMRDFADRIGGYLEPQATW